MTNEPSAMDDLGLKLTSPDISWGDRNFWGEGQSSLVYFPQSLSGSMAQGEMDQMRRPVAQKTDQRRQVHVVTEQKIGTTSEQAWTR